MIQGSRFKAIALFCGKFVLFAPICLVLWWLAVPYYVWALGQFCAWVLIQFGVPIDAMKVTSQGILNTETVLAFIIKGKEWPIPFARMVNNLPSFVILVLATPALGLLRRLKILAIGIGILVAGHALFLVLVCAFKEQINQAPEIPIALGKFLLTIPFILWIILAYWDEMKAFFSNGTGTEKP